VVVDGDAGELRSWREGGGDRSQLAIHLNDRVVVERLLAGNGILAEVVRLLSDANGTAERHGRGDCRLGNGDRSVIAIGTIAVGQDRGRVDAAQHLDVERRGANGNLVMPEREVDLQPHVGWAGCGELVQQSEVVARDHIPGCVPSWVGVGLDVDVHTGEQARPHDRSEPLIDDRSRSVDPVPSSPERVNGDPGTSRERPEPPESAEVGGRSEMVGHGYEQPPDPA